MPLIRGAEPFDHSDWIFELKHDGSARSRTSTATAARSSHRRDVHTQVPQLQEDFAHSV